MVTPGDVVRAPDPFKADSGNPILWLVIAGDSLPYPQQESIAVAFTTQSHHSGSFSIPGAEWLRGEPAAQSYVLPWTVATVKHDLHILGVQGTVTDECTNRVVDAVISILRGDTDED